MNTLCNDVTDNLLLKIYLKDVDALNLFKICKDNYVRIRQYHYKQFVDYQKLKNYTNCFITKIYNVNDLNQLQSLQKQRCTTKLTSLTFGYFFNSSIDDLPKSITHLIFGTFFNQNVDNLPNLITHLRFGFEFDQSVNNLPTSITHLKFGYCFNQPVDNLPNSIIHLTFGYCFKQSVEHLPTSTTHITFSYFWVDPATTMLKSRGISIEFSM